MAEALVKVLLERLAAIALDNVAEEFKLVSGVKKEVESLTRNLESIRVVLEDAEQRQVTEASVRRWLMELTEVSFDMDDVLDEWITEVLKHQMEKQEKQEKHALAIAEKVRSSASSIISGSKLRRLSHRRKIAGRIRELNERIASIDKAKERFSFRNTIREGEPVVRQKTTSLPIDKTFGRDKEKDLIVSKLLTESSQEKAVPLIIPIVGMGGMGKTTLAQLAYNDQIVQSRFDKKIWVCVSDPFDEMKIAKAILEVLDNDNALRNSNELQPLMQRIFELIKGKKFLLVLDDVWNPSFHQWEELIKPLRNGAIGSRMLVTTRKEEVVTLMKATTSLIHLKELGETFCLSLFYYNADLDEASVSKEFQDIGLEIVKRCKGLPLAAKTLGSLMRNKKTIHDWRVVLKSKTWELKEIQQDVFRPLLLSYQDLLPATKRCLLYCVIFPKDYVYKKKNLVELWMSQDYLNAKESKEKMTLGQNYFDDLVMRSFFQDVEGDDEIGNIRCKIHDIVHDFLQYLTKNECSFLEFELDESERKEVPNEKVHHLTLVHATESDSVRPFLLSSKKLRTLAVIDSSKNFIGPILKLIAQMKCLRALILWKGSLVEIPMMIGGLIHLRYLDLSGNEELLELPSALSSLYNLQTLRLVGCRRLTRVDVGRLINLRHLYVEGSSAQFSIEGIERLTNLQTLDAFGVHFHDEGNKLERLRNLNQLQGSITIDLGECPPRDEYKAGVIVNKAHLLQLNLKFNMFSYARKDREIMDCLEPNPVLESLTILYYEGIAFSHWLSSLRCLRVLCLSVCRNCKILPPFGKLASLESLDIGCLHGVGKVGVEFLGIEHEQTSSSSPFIAFPKLRQLTICDMESLEEWEGVEENSEKITTMPCLSQLTITKCAKLKALPDFLWKTPLQKLIIINSPILQMLYRRNGEQWTKISHIPNIEIKFP